MHKELDITVEQLSKIEGHSDLYVKIRKGEVKDVQLQITENKRFYTQAIRGKPANNIPQVVSRICGTCSVAHNTACTEAVEHAYGIRPSRQTLLLRNLSMHGQIIRDHAMHLYLFCLPDVFGKDSVLEFDKKQHQFVHDAFDVKAAGNNLCTVVAGRAVHPTYPQVGHFLKLPDRQQVKKTVSQLKRVRNRVLDLIEVFHKCDFRFERETQFVSLINKDFNFVEGEICSTEGHCIQERDYWDHLERVVIPYSQATAFEFENQEYMVGSLARINLNRKSLSKDTKKAASEFLKTFPSKNVFHNNLAQAIEILHSIDSSIKLLETHEFKPEPRPAIKPKMATGVGVVEAPRGTLYYMLSVKKDGNIGYGNIIIPTAQNQIKIGTDIKNLVQGIIDRPKARIQHEIEKLIRAYDPCMSCAAHFLKLKWDER
jgi:coenzyme F420-reducing hydrogenase alpha subunit